MFYVSLILAGGCGALLRYWAQIAAINLNLIALPFGTLLVNVLGSFLMGYLSWSMVHRWQLPKELQVVILTGFLGGFTTFSAFSLEVVNMFDQGFSGRAMFYILSSVVLSVGMCLLGIMLAKQG